MVLICIMKISDRPHIGQLKYEGMLVYCYGDWIFDGNLAAVGDRFMDRVLGLLFVFLLPTSTLAAEQIPVQFAGLAYISEHQDVETNFPFSKQVIDQAASSGTSLDKMLLSKVSTINNPSFTLQSDQLANLNGTDEAIVFAIALDRETISTEKIGDLYKLLVDISAQALFFDFKQATIIASYPIVLETINVYHETPTDAQKLEVVRRMLSSSKNDGLIDYASQLMKTVIINPKIGSRLGIRSV